MKIKPIQQINNKNNTNFKAKFINDNKGYFRKLWQDAELNQKFYETVDKFANNNKDHTLEITDYSNCCYTVFNHHNGFSRKCLVANCSYKNKLQTLLDSILSSKVLFNEGSASVKAYQKLTGQPVDKEFKI